MKRNLCTGCGSSVTRGYIFDRQEMQLCGQCRDTWLTYLTHIGMVMADTNWLVNELCEDSHYLSDAQWYFYDSLTQTRGIVLRLKK